MQPIDTDYDASINAIVVRLRGHITEERLAVWRTELANRLREHRHVALLMDTHQQTFASLDCVRWLKRFLCEDPVVRLHIDRAAFVRPHEVAEPYLAKPNEGYFTNLESAYSWLKMHAPAHCATL
ncbi:SpoIIAA-like protein [Alteromonadaceae bacterium 2753L.S.0a.02]|nr:SpoIIAA-like protein [Alteromonadaceae bacterium 2753L.S.0a.02]